jgi:aspartyl-tRNA(Asn)/glutamyl-tRNA(Gln) amidotransferase subunit A
VSVTGLRLAVPQTVAFDALDREVADAFGQALTRLSRAGVQIEEVRCAEFGCIASMNAKGGFAAAESYAWHRDLLVQKGEFYDPRVRSRILRGREQNAADYIELHAARRALIEHSDRSLTPFDAFILPTAAIVPPRLADLDTDDAYARTNVLALRNPTLINMIDGCAVSIPIHEPEAAPVGLMIAARRGCDRRLLAMAAALEPVLRQSSSRLAAA